MDISPIAEADTPGLHYMPYVPPSNNPFSTVGDMKLHLQIFLDAKEKQLHQVGALGQRVLAQQMELEELVRQIQGIEADKGEADEINAEAKDRYRDLAETMLSWDAENAQLYGAFGGSAKQNFSLNSPSQSVVFADLSKVTAGTSAAQSRRAKNAAHRADDVELTFEIGSGLLDEVRRLQQLLGERDKAIQDMKEEKYDLEMTLQMLQEQSADKPEEARFSPASEYNDDGGLQLSDGSPPPPVHILANQDPSSSGILNGAQDVRVDGGTFNNAASDINMISYNAPIMNSYPQLTRVTVEPSGYHSLGHVGGVVFAGTLLASTVSISL